MKLLFLIALGLSVISAETIAQPVGSESERAKCVRASDIEGYRVISDQIVRLTMSGSKDILLKLKRHCPQLHFHKYISYTPVNGQLCAGIDDVVSRSGMPCRIADVEETPKEPASQQ